MFEEFADPDVRAKSVSSLDSGRQVTRVGPGALWEVASIARQQGMARPLLIVDPSLFRSPSHIFIEARFAERGMSWESVACVTPTPLYGDVREGLAALTRGRCDGIITLGGGSAHDIGKAVALLGKNGGTLHDWAHSDKVATSILPHIAVNTTAGTGAEASSYAFLLEERGHEHTILHHDILRPKAAILDPITHLSMPRRVTAATGLNALSDAIEAYLSPVPNDKVDAQALEAVREIRTWLPVAFRDGSNLEARTHMARAAYLSGTAFDKAGLGIVDSISLVVSSLFNVGHSVANAIVLPHVMAFDAPSSAKRFPALAEALGRPGEKDPVEAAIRAVVDLKAEVGLSESFGDRGLGWDDLYLCAHNILRHPFSKRSARPLDEQALAQILLGAMEHGAEGAIQSLRQRPAAQEAAAPPKVSASSAPQS